MKKNLIIVTGGAGFVGSNLISSLVEKTNYKIISIDNYSSGLKNNHMQHKHVKYIKGKLKLFFILENFLEFIKVF